MEVAIRIHWTALECQEKKLFDYIAERADAVCAVEHPPDTGCRRTHVHIYASALRVKKQAFYDYCDKIGVEPGNGARSFKTTYDTDNPTPVNKGFLSYMSKGSIDPVFLKGITMDEYNEYKAKGFSKQDETSPAKSKKEKSEVTDFAIYEEIVSKLDTPYECSCYHCNGIEVPYGQKKIPTKPVVWEPTDTHHHVQHAMSVIRDIRRKYRKMTNSRKMEEYMYMLINHKDINSFSASRMTKFLFS